LRAFVAHAFVQFAKEEVYDQFYEGSLLTKMLSSLAGEKRDVKARTSSLLKARGRVNPVQFILEVEAVSLSVHLPLKIHKRGFGNRSRSRHDCQGYVILGCVKSSRYSNREEVLDLGIFRWIEYREFLISQGPRFALFQLFGSLKSAGPKQEVRAQRWNWTDYTFIGDEC